MQFLQFGISSQKAESRLAERNPELFWGIRGGGGNFGVVTSFEFELHDLGPRVLAGPVVHAFEDAPNVLRRMAEIMSDAPDEVSCLPVIRHAPPAPFIPEAFHGEMILLLALIYAGDPAEGEAAPYCLGARAVRQYGLYPDQRA